MSEAARPARARRVSSSLGEKPASPGRRGVRIPLGASTTRALPPLPPPRPRKRITRRVAGARRSLQIVEKQADDPFAVVAELGLALRVENRDRAHRAFGGDLDAVLGQAALVLLAEGEQLGEEVRLLAAGELGIDVA